MICIPAGPHTELVGAYVAEKTGCDFQPGMFQALAVLDDSGTFCGAVVVSEYRGHDCQLHTAADTSMVWRPHVIRAVFDYVFNQLGCVRCTACTKKSNRKSRAFLEGLGFVLEGRLRKGFDGQRDALLYGMLKSECTHLETINGNTQAESTASAESADRDTEEPTAANPATVQEAV